MQIRPSPTPWVALTFLLWIAHALGILWLANPPAGWLDPAPFLDQDWALHHLHLRSAEAFWRADGRLWGYNPFFMAGYPANTIQDLSIKLYLIAALLTPGAEPVVAFKLWVWAFASAVPWACYGAFANFFSGRDVAAWGPTAAALLGTAYWWNSLPREMLFYGMVGFPAACFLALIGLSWLWRLANSERIGWPHAAWLVTCCLLVPLHAQVALALTLPGGLLLLLARSPRAWLWAGAGAALALVANLVWVAPLLAHVGDARFGAAIDDLPYFSSPDPWTLVKDHFTAERYWTFRDSAWEKVLRSALLLVGGGGLVQLLRARRAEGIVLLAWIGPLLWLAYFGSATETFRGWQCLRFKIPVYAALALCAARALAARGAPGTAGLGRGLAAGLLGAGLVGFAANLAATEARGELRMHARPRAPVPELVEWLRTSAPRAGRLLFEESGDETGFFWGGTYLSALLPFWTGHQLIGGPANNVIDRHHFAEFHSGRLFGRPIGSFTDAELRERLRRYNVATIVTFHPDSGRRLAALGAPVAPVARFDRPDGRGRAQVWRVEQEPSWLLAGRADVRAELGRLEVRNAAGPELILKYHWIEGLASDPPLAVEPHAVGDDPIPFVRVEAPPERFTLSVGGGSRGWRLRPQ